MAERTSGRLDRFGVGASSLCAVHCLAGAVFAGSSGLIGFVRRPGLELSLVASAMLLAVWSLVSSYRRHALRLPLVLMGFAFALIGAARLGSWPSERAETILSISGAALLVCAHVINLRALRRLDACC